MSTYDVLRTKTQALGGSAGPAGIGSVNITGGAEIKIRYQPLPDPGFRVVSVVPYLVGSDEAPPSSSPPPDEHQRLLAWQYKPDTGPPPHAPPGWRCFKVEQIDAILPGPAPRPASLPTLDADRQNCVRTY
jgi:hypothetical protein